jgi:voltage-gated potassium channel Kch
VIGPAFRYIARARLRETFTAAALLLVIGIALLMQLVGLSPALGAFVGGVVLAGSEFRHELEGDLEPFKGLLLGLFFLAVGASLDFALVAERLGVVTAVVAGLITLKGAILWAIGGGRGTLPDQRMLFAVALAQGGEFCFVLLAFATQNAVLPAEVAGVATAAVALSMALTPLLFVVYDRVLRPRLACAAAPPARPMDDLHGDAPVLVLGYGHFGSTVGRLLRAAGFRQTVLDFDSERVEFLRRLGLDVFYGDASREELLRAAGAAEARLALICLRDVEKTLAIAETFRRHFPHVTVLARAKGRFEAYDLLNAGIGAVYRDSLDTSLRMAADALAALGVARHAAARAALAFRKRDERTLRHLAPAWRSEAYVSEARRVIEEIEEAFRGDAGRVWLRDDAAWDAETLREEYRDLGR